MFQDPTLVGCWPTFAAHLDADAVIGVWGSREPELTGIADVDALLSAWSDPVRTHEVGAALVRLAAVDGAADDDALILLPHLLSGVVWRLVGQLADLSGDITALGARRTHLPDPGLSVAYPASSAGHDLGEGDAAGGPG